MEKNESKNANSESFEFCMNEIERIISEMESSNIDELDQLIENFEYGSKMLNKCQKILKTAELRVQKITEKIEGETADESN